MSTQQTELPPKVARKVSNRNGDEWYQYDGDPLFSDNALERIRERFREMRESEYESIASPKGGSSFRKKIRSKDIDAFTEDLIAAADEWVDEHGERLTNFGNAAYGEILDGYGVVVLWEENPRKTVLKASYEAGYHAGLGGADHKKQQILLPIRNYEQWSYHTEVVEPLFDAYHEKYPY